MLGLLGVEHWQKALGGVTLVKMGWQREEFLNGKIVQMKLTVDRAGRMVETCCSSHTQDTKNCSTLDSTCFIKGG